MDKRLDSKNEYYTMAIIAWALIIGTNICLIGACRLSYEMFYASYGRFVLLDLSGIWDWLSWKINVAHTFAAGMYAMCAGCLHLLQSSMFGAMNKKYLNYFENKIGLSLGKITERVEKVENELAGVAPSVNTRREDQRKEKRNAYNVTFNRGVFIFATAIYFILALVSYFQAQRISLEERNVSFNSVIEKDDEYMLLKKAWEDAKDNLRIAQGVEKDSTVTGLISNTKTQADWAQANRQKINAGIANQRMSTLAQNLKAKTENVTYWSGQVETRFVAMDGRRKQIIANFDVVEKFANAIGPGLLEVLAYGGAIALAILNCFRRGVLPIYPVRPVVRNSWRMRRKAMRKKIEGKIKQEDETKTEKTGRKEPRRKPGQRYTIEEMQQEIETGLLDPEEQLEKIVSSKYSKVGKGATREQVQPLTDFDSIFQKSETFEEFLEWLMISIPCPYKRVRSKVEAWIYLRGLAFCRFKGDQGLACKHKEMERNRAHRYFNQGLRQAAYLKKHNELNAWVDEMNTRLKILGVPVIAQAKLKCAIKFPDAIITRGSAKPYGSIKRLGEPEEVIEVKTAGEGDALIAQLLAENPQPQPTVTENGNGVTTEGKEDAKQD